MPPAPLLDGAEITARLASRGSWRRENGRLTRTLTTRDYRSAIELGWGVTTYPSWTSTRPRWSTTGSTQRRIAMDFNSILIGSADPERLVEYYTRVLGTPGFSDGGYTGWQVGSGFVTVGPHSDVTGRNASPGRIIWNIESKDVAAEFERMKAAGAIVVKEPYGFESQPGSLIATFADPDDNYFQLMSPMEM